MIHAQKTKSVVFMAPIDVVTNETQSGTGVDTLGWDYAQIDVMLETQTAVSDNPQVFDLRESADATTYSTIAAFLGDTGWTVPDVSTTVATTVRFNVDLRKRERYLAVFLTTQGADQYCSGSGQLSRRHGSQYTPAAETDAQLGCTEIVTG